MAVKTFRAFAAGAIAPAGDDGLPGPAASAWEIHDENSQELEREIRPGRAANRRIQHAQWAAIRGVVESSAIPDGSKIDLWIQDPMMRGAIDHDFVRTSGKLYEDREWWEPVRDAIKRRALRLTVWTDKTEFVLSVLVEDAKATARDRLDQIGPEQATRDAAAVPVRSKKPKKPKPGEFPPV